MALNMDEKLIEYLTPNEANEKISQYLQDMRDEPHCQNSEKHVLP